MPTVLSLRSGEPRRVGRYRLIGRIEGFAGADGGPEMFTGRSAQGDQVTVTLLGKARAADVAAQDRFTAEATAARRVDPFCVSRILDSGLADGRPYLVSEYLPGASLREAAIEDGPLSGAPLLALATGMAAGLAAIHQAGLVHGAFGPDYVVLSPEGPRVVHFSIAPPYGDATPAADMLAWSLTVMFAAVGRPTVGPQDLTALPEPLRSVVSACLTPDPAGRPAARAVLAWLMQWEDPASGLLAEGARRARGAARNAPQTAPGRPSAQGTPKTRSRTVIWVLACTACLLAIAAAGWFISLGPGTTGTSLESASSQAGTRARAVPAGMAGTWTGEVRQVDPVLAVTVQITLRAGATRAAINYPALGCSGTLRALPGTSAALSLAQHITVGRRSCDDGVVMLTALGSGQLQFSFRRSSGPSPAGVLARAVPSPAPSPS